MLLKKEESIAEAYAKTERETASSLETTKAKGEAELIQAEAKARARVEGEANILTTKAIHDATFELEESARAEELIRNKLRISRAKLTV